MIYLLYRLGHLIARTLPLKASYKIACAIADMQMNIQRTERAVVNKNIDIVTGGGLSPDEVKIISRKVFRNFAKYLVDFFRASQINDEFIKKNVMLNPNG